MIMCASSRMCCRNDCSTGARAPHGRKALWEREFRPIGSYAVALDDAPGRGEEVAELGLEPEGDVLLLDEVLEGGGALGPLFRGHREGAVEGADGAFEVCRRHREAVVGQL